MNNALTIKPEDKTKVIALGAAATLLFGYAGINFARSALGSSAAAPPAPTATPAPSASAVVPGKPLPGTNQREQAPPLDPEKASISNKAVKTAEDNRVVIADLSLDPFSPVAGNKGRMEADGLPRKAGADSVNPPPVSEKIPTKPLFGQAPPADASTPANMGMPEGIPGLSSRVLPPLSTVGGTRTATGMIPPMLMPDIPLTLAGIIRGEGAASAVAMIQVGEGQQFVRVGDVIEGWGVVSIGGDAVTLRRNKRLRTLRIGAGASQSATPYLAPIPAAAPTPLPAMLPTAAASPMPPATSVAALEPGMPAPTGPVELTPQLTGTP